VEDFSYPKERGCISAVEIFDGSQYKILGPVLEESFHLSFPYLFEYQQNLYMIPESSEVSAIRVYKCAEFPLKWVFCKELMKGVRAVDTMVFEHQGRWWLFTNVASPGSHDSFSQLAVFHGPDPIGDEWTPHEGNPVVFDSRIGRNAGILDRGSGLPVRCRQRHGFERYGAGLTFARIVELTATAFREVEIGQMTPDFFPGLLGCHHMDSNGAITVYDYVRRETLMLCGMGGGMEGLRTEVPSTGLYAAYAPRLDIF
jgi:hypothetical protein